MITSFQYTAYAALLDQKAACQGYAVLFYRMALELGVDSRLISGTEMGRLTDGISLQWTDSIIM